MVHKPVCIPMDLDYQPEFFSSLGDPNNISADIKSLISGSDLAGRYRLDAGISE